MGYIYCITNLINSKKYIGQTVNSIQERWKDHCRARKYHKRKNAPLYDAFDKYGIENFKIEELEYVNDNSKLSDREIYWIKELQTYGRNGYNATKGGEGTTLYDHTEIIELYNLGYSTQQIADKIHCSQTNVDKVLRSNGIKSRGRSKMVEQWDKAGNFVQTFDSTSLALQWLIDNGVTTNVNGTGKIVECCKNQRKSAYGYIWKYSSIGNVIRLEEEKDPIDNPYNLEDIYNFVKSASKEELIEVYFKYKESWINKGIFTYYAEDYFKYRNSPKLYNSVEAYILQKIYRSIN